MRLLSGELSSRFESNPILCVGDFLPSRPGWKVKVVLNPGVFRYRGRIGLVVRVAEMPPQEEGCLTIALRDASERQGVRLKRFQHSDATVDFSDPRVIRCPEGMYVSVISHLRLAWSEDGIHFAVDSAPLLEGDGELEAFGVEDCRVSQIGDRYWLQYTAVSACGYGVGLASTRDWIHFERHGMIFPTANKDCAIFEEKVGDWLYALHRPSSVGFGGNDLWLARSSDLVHWGAHRCIARTRPGRWDATRIGAGGSPIRTNRGWLVIYHGANQQNRYCLGTMLLDLEQPWRVLARRDEPVMEPVAPYEVAGFFGNVIFSCGQLVNGDEITLYYGAADECVCGTRLSISELLSTF